MTQSRISRQMNRLKLVIAGPPNCGKSEMLHALAARIPGAVLRDYKVGWIDVLRLDYTWETPQEDGSQLSISVHALVGPVEYQAMYEMIISNAQAVLMMIDINPARQAEGVQVLAQTEDVLRRRGLALGDIPLLFQYHRAEMATQELVQQWDHLLDLHNTLIPRYFSATDFAEGSFTGYDLLVREAVQLLRSPRSA